MYIIDSNKDYYDYVSHIYGLDKKIVFDRRGSTRIESKDLVDLRETRYYGGKTQFILLETGMVQYLLKLDNIVVTDENKPKNKHIDLSAYQHVKSFDVEIVDKFEDHKNVTGCPIAIRSVHNSWRSYHYIKQFPTEYKDYKITNDIELDLPILASTCITKIIPAEEIWKNICNYISSLGNDKDVAQASDIEKIVNHGFDKKESFRGNRK